MIVRLCYYYGYTPAQVMDLPFPNFFMLLSELEDLRNSDPRGKM